MQKLKEVKMSYFTNEDVMRVKAIDLLTYLQNFEPANVKQVSGNVYRTVDHDSLVISNGKWCWFSQGIGGKSALDYLCIDTSFLKIRFDLPCAVTCRWHNESFLSSNGRCI